MSMKPPCERCGWRHVPSIAVGKFSWTVPLFRGPHEGAPLRETREHAQQDQCDHNLSRGAES